VSLPTDRDWLTPDEFNAYQAATAKKSQKYGAVPVTIDGIRFASTGEGARYAALRQQEQAGAIRRLRLQVPYPLTVGGLLIATYVADFVYEERADGGDWAEVVEDFKGVRTEGYRLKRRLMKACHGIDIRETGR